MPYLFNEIPFPDGSRMTGVFTSRKRPGAMDHTIVSGHLISLAEGQIPDVEGDFLLSHLPFSSCGFTGVYPDGNGFVFVMQQAPSDVSDRLGLDDAHEPLHDSLRRALAFNPGARLAWDIEWSGLEIGSALELHGADVDEIICWPVADLLRGLLADCCNVPVPAIVQGYERDCAFPDEAHACEADVFRDVFVRWTSGELREKPTPTGRPLGPSCGRCGTRMMHQRGGRELWWCGWCATEWTYDLDELPTARTEQWADLERWTAPLVAAGWTRTRHKTTDDTYDDDGVDIDYQGVACDLVRDNRVVQVERQSDDDLLVLWPVLDADDRWYADKRGYEGYADVVDDPEGVVVIRPTNDVLAAFRALKMLP